MAIYHHVGKQYLDQYLREFDFRYNVRKLNDQDRDTLALKIDGYELVKFPKANWV